KHGCLVHTALVLLRRGADNPRLTGEWIQQFAGETPHRVFRYQVIRVWQLSADALINGGWGTFPLAPLCDDARLRLPDVIERMATRLQNEVADVPKLAMLWKTTAILADMCYDQDVILPLMRKAMTMVKLEDFPSYTKGEIKSARRLILLIGKKMIGDPDPQTVAALEAINNLDRLDRMANRLPDVKSWQELLSEK
ncbi:MAG TPA: hypothetical protein VFE62_00950, partial [Gemmataceae bacterium]|nr:hypothetical protein [Gemmataceae bacterium]